MTYEEYRGHFSIWALMKVCKLVSGKHLAVNIKVSLAEYKKKYRNTVSGTVIR